MGWFLLAEYEGKQITFNRGFDILDIVSIDLWIQGS
jgi:hypothetical protein